MVRKLLFLEKTQTFELSRSIIEILRNQKEKKSLFLRNVRFRWCEMVANRRLLLIAVKFWRTRFCCASLSTVNDCPVHWMTVFTASRTQSNVFFQKWKLRQVRLGCRRNGRDSEIKFLTSTSNFKCSRILLLNHSFLLTRK